jgi:type 1 glutamine amidotransferase
VRKHERIKHHEPNHDYAIAWIRRWGEGRVFYCSLGHVHSVTWDPAIVRFNLAGIQYALGDLKADDAPASAAK